MIPAVPPRVFISHASADAALAFTICDGLESRGVRCWIAPRDVQSDGTYGTEILKGLRECEVFLILVSDAAAESQQVEREAERASHYKKRIIPLVLGQSESGPRLEYYIAGRQRFPCAAVPTAHFLDTLAKDSLMPGATGRRGYAPTDAVDRSVWTNAEWGLSPVTLLLWAQMLYTPAIGTRATLSSMNAFIASAVYCCVLAMSSVACAAAIGLSSPSPMANRWA